jgi:hypothetical protein
METALLFKGISWVIFGVACVVFLALALAGKKDDER